MHINRGVALIGMPAVGKSTVSSLLAQRLQWRFLDADQLIMEQAGRSLQELVEQENRSGLIRREQEVLLGLDAAETVVATGGSAVYSDAAMVHLAAMATIVYLEIDYASLELRMPNYEQRGIARDPGQSLLSLYEERVPLYQKFADLTIACGQAADCPVAATLADTIEQALSANFLDD